MNYAAIKDHDVANGPGVRVSLFVSGCKRRCPGCFNQEAQDFGYGRGFDAEARQHILKALEPEHIAGLSVLGGEPFEIENQFEVLKFLMDVRTAFPQKTIWAWSGYTFDELMARPGMDGVVTKRLLRTLNVLVDGPFVEARKDLSLRFRGSKNQRIIDVPATLQFGAIKLWDGEASR